MLVYFLVIPFIRDFEYRDFTCGALCQMKECLAEKMENFQLAVDPILQFFLEIVDSGLFYLSTVAGTASSEK